MGNKMHQFKDIDLEGFKTFMSIYLENELSLDLIRRLFLSFVKKPEQPEQQTIGITSSIEQGKQCQTNETSSSHHHHHHHSLISGGIFSQSNSTISGAIHSIQARFNFPSLGGIGGGANLSTTAASSSGQNQKALMNTTLSDSDAEESRIQCSHR
ncbi:hypothetical protein BLA29_011128 [Euroglyphus maynei]|uniref:Diacylglycerol kinase type I N-terminal domain-containing protein n=1 Tax=Euroglyphus maynei TaxID=6958 RepID=A0A1Y3AVA6_EURMA|nr:hypothetical protein BLA29_011128 [Euroglyphus maynei]